MLTDWGGWITWFEAALRGAAQPWVICVALVLTTFLLEDLAIAAGAGWAGGGGGGAGAGCPAKIPYRRYCKFNCNICDLILVTN